MFRRDSARYCLMMAIVCVIGFVVDFQIMSGWGLSLNQLVFAWLSIVFAVTVGYWIAVKTIRDKKVKYVDWFGSTIIEPVDSMIWRIRRYEEKNTTLEETNMKLRGDKT